MAGSNPIQPSICLFNQLSSNRVQAAFYLLCGKPWRSSYLLPLPWERVGVRASLGTYPFRGGRRFWSGYGGDTPCPAVKAAAPVLPCPFLRKRESGGCTYKQVRKQIAATLKCRLLLNLSKSSLHFNYFFIFIDLNNLHGTTATRRSTLLPLPLRRTGGRRDSLICGQGATRRNRRHKYRRA